jgi:hypothetical protein
MTHLHGRGKHLWSDVVKLYHAIVAMKTLLAIYGERSDVRVEQYCHKPDILVARQFGVYVAGSRDVIDEARLQPVATAWSISQGVYHLVLLWHWATKDKVVQIRSRIYCTEPRIVRGWLGFDLKGLPDRPTVQSTVEDVFQSHRQ